MKPFLFAATFFLIYVTLYFTAYFGAVKGSILEFAFFCFSRPLAQTETAFYSCLNDKVTTKIHPRGESIA